MDDVISRQATYLALVEKGQASKRYKLGETWELNGKEIREVLDALPSVQPELSEIKRDLSDLISREAAIHAVFESAVGRQMLTGHRDLIDILKNLPPAQPDLSGYSSRLWKAAYERGKAEAQPDLDEVYAHAETEAEARFHAQIVRCKDCVYAADDDYHHCSYVTWWNGENDFCSKGKRKTDEQAD